MLRNLCTGLSKTLILLAFFSSHLFAQNDVAPKEKNNEKNYQIELIVFARNGVNTQEQWPTNLSLSYPEDSHLLGEATMGDFMRLPASARSLNAQAATLAKSGSYSLLFHEAWQQRITANKTHIVLSGGKLINNHHELEGSISLSVAQYLSLQTNLWLTHFTGVESLTPSIWPSLPTPPGPSDLAIAEVDTNNKTTIDRIVALKETRSMRSNEIHYIDHPLLGVIVKIQPAP